MEFTMEPIYLNFNEKNRLKNSIIRGYCSYNIG